MDRRLFLNVGVVIALSGAIAANVGCNSKSASKPATPAVSTTTSQPPAPVSTEATTPAPVSTKATTPAPVSTNATIAKPPVTAKPAAPTTGQSAAAKPAPNKPVTAKTSTTPPGAATSKPSTAKAAPSRVLASAPKPATISPPSGSTITKPLAAPLAKPQAAVNLTADRSMPGQTTGPDVDAARTKILAQYAKIDKGIAAEDAKMVMSVYDTDWGKVHINGKKSQLGRQQNYFQRVFARMKNLHAKSTLRSFSLDGKVAYSIARTHWAGRAHSGKMNKEVWSYADFIVKDEWEKQASGEWLMVSETLLKRVLYAPDHQVKVNEMTLPADAPDDEHPAPAPSDMIIDAVQ